MASFKRFLKEDPDEYVRKFSNAPEWSPELAEGNYSIKGITFSAEHGAGQVPFNQSVYYHGFVVLIRPSVFLQLALPHTQERHLAAKEIIKLIDEGYSIGIPFMDISLRDFEDRGEPPRITGHEGRARMLAIKSLIGDEPVPVHMILTGGLRARHLDDGLIAAIKGRVRSEDGSKIISSPYEGVFVNAKMV